MVPILLFDFFEFLFERRNPLDPGRLVTEHQFAVGQLAAALQGLLAALCSLLCHVNFLQRFLGCPPWGNLLKSPAPYEPLVPSDLPLINI